MLLRINADDATPRRPSGPRPPTRCTMNSYYFPARNREVPMLRLRGLWLEVIGLTIGSRYGTSAEPGRLVVTLVAPPPAPVAPRPKRMASRSAPTSR